MYLQQPFILVTAGPGTLPAVAVRMINTGAFSQDLKRCPGLDALCSPETCTTEKLWSLPYGSDKAAQNECFSGSVKPCADVLDLIRVTVWQERSADSNQKKSGFYFWWCGRAAEPGQDCPRCVKERGAAFVMYFNVQLNMI